MKWLNHQAYKDVDFASKESYPINRGFQKFYGIIWGVVNYFDPFSLVEGDKIIKEVPKDAPLLSSVWQMKRKRKPSTGEISKYKARMNVNGKEQIKGIHYDETYAPVVGWSTIRFSCHYQ